MRHKCFESATLIHGDPLFYSFVIVLYDRTIGQSERRTGDSFVVSSSGSEVLIVDNSKDDGKLINLVTAHEISNT